VVVAASYVVVVDAMEVGDGVEAAVPVVGSSVRVHLHGPTDQLSQAGLTSR
jgi:hypothetical protein